MSDFDNPLCVETAIDKERHIRLKESVKLEEKYKALAIILDRPEKI